MEDQAMPEIRQNIISRQWVIISAERARRPDEFRSSESRRKQLPQHDPACPFCPGNEAMTPNETYRSPETGDWQVRAFPNKFAALSSEGDLVRHIDGLKRTISGVGVHEVIVESRKHNTTLALMTNAEVENVIAACLDRYNKVLADHRVEAITLFKNHGAAAGTSLVHPHMQLIGTPVIPNEVRERLEWALRFYDDNGTCIFCATLASELRDQIRLIAENEHFVAFIPFAALSPFHMWIYPRRHCASFQYITHSEISSLARILRSVQCKLYLGLQDPDFNMTLRTAPKESHHIRYYHWYMSIVPRVTKTAGFELGSGMFINVSPPESSAAFLRGVAVE
jgi:UDPglucose--hexose-1-phosphate uridylyltransferase